MATLSEYFSRHEEQAFIVKAFLTIFAIMLIREYLSSLLMLLFILFPVLFLIYIRLQAAALDMRPTDLLAQHITFMPVMHTDKELLRKETPYVTYGIVLLNVVIYYLLEVGFDNLEFIEKNLLFLPLEPNAWNIPASLFSSMFLHASSSHLWGNMLFLWAIGSVVERRIGPQRFGILYLVTGLFGSLAYVLVEFLANGTAGHALGASGAISGIMGIFAVRCYFKSMVFPLPVLGIFSLIFPISLKVRLNSLVIIGLFFLADLSGGIGQLAGTNSSMIGHWAHLGGMISGMIIAGFLKLGKDAVEERHLEAGVQASHAKTGYAGGEKSIALVLQNSPDNPDALLAMARLKSKFTPTDEGREYYAKAIATLLRSRQQEAADAFKEYYQKYLKGLDPALLLTLAGILQRRQDLNAASRCLEMAAGDPDASPQIRERALLQNAILLNRMGLEEATSAAYQTYLREFPHGDSAAKARMYLGLPEPEMQPHTAPPPPPAAPRQTTDPTKQCPACREVMVKRTATNGEHAGKQFWVCKGYPASCKTVEAVG